MDINFCQRMKLKVVKEKCGQLQSSETSLKVENAELINSMKVQKDEYQRSLEDKIQVNNFHCIY